MILLIVDDDGKGTMYPVINHIEADIGIKDSIGTGIPVPLGNGVIQILGP